ncbi:hypothetical protein TNCV_1974101 [Trichonephila clavipes]|nr:hypothetical protein TNCV_1974101 [Trichonephila clavipes]
MHDSLQIESGFRFEIHLKYYRSQTTNQGLKAWANWALAQGLSSLVGASFVLDSVLKRPEVILSMDELNLDQAPQDINKEEFLLERVRLQVLVAATDPGCS